MIWKTIDRPSYFGKRRDSIQKGYDEKYGSGKWRLAHKFGDNILEFKHAIQIYEDSYYEFMKNGIAKQVSDNAVEVFDNAETNIDSGLNYFNQENNSNHYQDISVRRILMRLGLSFNGSELIQIRHNSNSKLGKSLSPGYIPFHKPELIEQPHNKGWWEKDTVEDFWQSNKVLQILT